MNFIFLILSFLLLVFSRQILIDLLVKIAGPSFVKTIYFLLFFPGVIIHELAHFFVASLLFVPTGEISIFPEEKRMGSIQVAKTDPIREAIIGLAPTIMGTAGILAIFSFANPKNLFWLYLVFAINNTMFASESDRRSWLGLLALIALIASSLYLFGLLSLVAGPFLHYANLAANLIATAYGSTFLVNLAFIIPLFIFQKIIEKLR